MRAAANLAWLANVRSTVSRPVASCGGSSMSLCSSVRSNLEFWRRGRQALASCLRRGPPKCTAFRFSQTDALAGKRMMMKRLPGAVGLGSSRPPLAAEK